MVELYLHSSIRLHGMVLNYSYLSKGTTLPFTSLNVYSTKQIDTLCRQNAEILNDKAGDAYSTSNDCLLYD
jgi:hypothetical protein